MSVCLLEDLAQQLKSVKEFKVNVKYIPSSPHPQFIVSLNKRTKKKGGIKWLGWIGLVSVKVASCRAGGQPVVWNLNFNCKAAFSLSLRGHFIGVL